MKTGYDQFFKKAKGAARQSSSNIKKSEPLKAQRHPLINPEPKKSKKRNPIPWKLAGLSFLGAVAALMLLLYADGVESFLSQFQITWNPLATAAESSKPSPEPSNKKPVEKQSSSKKEQTSDSSAAIPGTPSNATAEHDAERNPQNEAGVAEQEKEDELDHLARLSERKQELDAREEELVRQEVALKKQREDIEKRMLDLEKVRQNISNVLDERVKVDEAKVESLVQTISNMKPPQAAKMIEDLDESLAVEIVGRMKKKNAAEILNLIKVEKGRSLVEKYAGYKRK